MFVSCCVSIVQQDKGQAIVLVRVFQLLELTLEYGLLVHLFPPDVSLTCQQQEVLFVDGSQQGIARTE